MLEPFSESPHLVALQRMVEGRSLTIKELIAQAHGTAVEKGWWDGERNPEKDFPTMVANVHGEVSEAWEEFRNHHAFNELYFNQANPGKPEGIPAELADVMIRIADFAGRYCIDLEAALKAKMEFNKTRPARHGGKRA